MLVVLILSYLNSKMQRLLVTNGCSHTAGSEIPGAGIGDGPECREKCFSSLVAKELNRTPIHLAVPGGSNERIARSTMAWIGDNLHAIQNKDIDVVFLVHWTSSERIDYHFSRKNFGEADRLKVAFTNYANDEFYKTITSQTPVPQNASKPMEDVFKAHQTLFLHSAETWSDNKIKNIISLQSVLKSYNIPYWFGDSFFCDYYTTPTYRSLRNLVDTTYFPYHDRKDMSYYWMCNAAGFKNQDLENRMWHLGADAHKYYASWLLKELEKVKLNG